MQTGFSKDQIHAVNAAEQLKRELLPHIAGPMELTPLNRTRNGLGKDVLPG